MRSFITCEIKKYLGDLIKKDEKSGSCRTHGRDKGKRPLGGPRRRWKCNIGIDLREIGWDILDWIHQAEDGEELLALVNTAMKLRIPQKAENFFDS
jgi:hypothetical protein